MTQSLTPDQIEALKTLTTPTVANAIELFDVRPRNQGFMAPGIRCLFPEFEPLVGYAWTATFRSNVPAPVHARETFCDYLEGMLGVPAPRIAVIQDIDDPPAVGSFWGEVNANIHRAVGCVGTITNGGVRDLDEVRELGFHFFAAEVIPTHAYTHIVSYGNPVTVGGLIVRPGDLIHADKHGIVIVPHEIAPKLVEATEQLLARERKIIELCQSPDFNLAALRALLLSRDDEVH